jgi:hypothetical protein
MPSIINVCLIVSATVCCAALVIAPFFFQPIEDAAILYQYADNFARTGIISYIENGPRAEGGTDFLWLILLAAGDFLGIGAFPFTGWINAASAIGIGLLLVKVSGHRVSAANVAMVTLLPLAFPQVWAAIAGFSVFPFGFLIALCAYAFIRHQDTLLAGAMLLLCLFRPDGIVFAAPLAAMRLIDGPDRIHIVKRQLTLFVLPGTIYFIWRWNYFGELLPLPFIVKSNAPRGFGPFVSAETGLHDLHLALEWSLPIIIIFVTSAARRRLNIELLLSLIVIPSIFYSSMRLDQNWTDRFHFYIVIATAMVAAVNWHDIRVPGWAVAVLVASLYILELAQPWKTYALERIRDRTNNIAAIARELNTEGLRGTMATTEAGRLAFYSRWPAYDLWGLNTPQFAHHLMQPQELTALNADLVVVYFPQNGDICLPNPGWKTPYEQRTWGHLGANAVVALSTAPYQLWMVPWGGPIGGADSDRPMYRSPTDDKYLCFYVRNSYRDKESVVALLKRHGAITPDDHLKQIGTAGRDGGARSRPD